MSEIVIVRHGETEWSRSMRHTGNTDIPLTEEGEAAARRVGERLAVFGEREIGDAGVLARAAPLGLAVADEDDLAHSFPR